MEASAAFATFDTAIGRCALAWRGDVVIGVALPEADEDRLAAGIARRFPGAVPAEPPPGPQRAIALIAAHLAGERVDYSGVTLDFGDCALFERQVYAAAARIPCGSVRTYGDLARTLGAPGAARAVGVALGRNPVPIIVPCHRVVASDGKAGGFSAPGGTATKFRILEIEGARADRGPELFEHLPLAVRPD